MKKMITLTALTMLLSVNLQSKSPLEKLVKNYVDSKFIQTEQQVNGADWFFHNKKNKVSTSLTSRTVNEAGMDFELLDVVKSSSKNEKSWPHMGQMMVRNNYATLVNVGAFAKFAKDVYQWSNSFGKATQSFTK
jgi:hypothetical protein